MFGKVGSSDLNSTPNAIRKHIAIFGKTNSGKSSLLNAIVGQDVSLVSSVHGTTTDPVQKAMELIPFGPVVFVDTAGLNDTGELGELRVKRTLKILQGTDFALYIMDINDVDETAYQNAVKKFKKYSIPHLLVVTKTDTVSEADLAAAKMKLPDAVFVSSVAGANVLSLKDLLIEKLRLDEAEETIVGDLVPYAGKVIMVVPVDSEAPKGRIILPQVQLIRDCLDHGIKSYVVRDTELASALADLNGVNLVVTDSQAFRRVSELVPREINLTSFSILFARHKGDLRTLVEGAAKVRELTRTSRILITEACSHNHSHEDIGRVKIPMLLNKYVGAELNYDFKMGHDFPDNVGGYDLVIHCGSCMLNKKVMQTRIDLCVERGVKITNYGVVLAYLTGILDRCVEMFAI